MFNIFKGKNEKGLKRKEVVITTEFTTETTVRRQELLFPEKHERVIEQLPNKNITSIKLIKAIVTPSALIETYEVYYEDNVHLKLV